MKRGSLPVRYAIPQISYEFLTRRKSMASDFMGSTDSWEVELIKFLGSIDACNAITSGKFPISKRKETHKKNGNVLIHRENLKNPA
jgi:hypothetical protein